MKTYSLEIEIELPRSKVSELFGNPDNLGYWQPGFVSIEPLDGESDLPETRHRLLYTQGKREIEMIETVEVDGLPDEYIATYVAKGMRMRVANRFEKIDENRTRWVSDNEAHTSGLLMMLFGILMPGCFKKESFRMMKNFKAFAENGDDVRKS